MLDVVTMAWDNTFVDWEKPQGDIMSVQFKPNLSRYIKFALEFQEVMENGTDIEK